MKPAQAVLVITIIAGGLVASRCMRDQPIAYRHPSPAAPQPASKTPAATPEQDAAKQDVVSSELANQVDDATENRLLVSRHSAVPSAEHEAPQGNNTAFLKTSSPPARVYAGRYELRSNGALLPRNRKQEWVWVPAASCAGGSCGGRNGR